MINYLWEIETQWTWKNETSVKETMLHIIAPNIITACTKANALIIKTTEASKKAEGNRSEKNLAVIVSAEQMQRIDS